MYKAMPHTVLSAEQFCDRLEDLPPGTPRLELGGVDIFKIEDEEGVQLLVANDGSYALVNLQA